MKIYKYVRYEYNGTDYIRIKEISYEHSGPVELACGATPQQGAIANSQQGFMNQAVQQATTTFGAANTVFNNLMSTFAPTVAAGPSQQGFSQGELSNLNSQAITQTGQEYQNEKAATGNAMAAAGGGTSALPSGATEGADLSLAENAGNQTANELSQIKQADYQQGVQNYNTAAQGLEAATGVFNPATSATGAATGAGTAAANTANQVAQENQSWVQSVTGALGGIAGAAVGNPAGLAGIFHGASGGAPMLSNVNGPSTLAPQSVGGTDYNFPTNSGIPQPSMPSF